MLGEGRQFGQRRGAAERRHAERAQLAGAHLAHRDARDHEAGLDLTGEDRVDHLREALVRHMNDVEPGAGLEQLHREVRGAAVADAAIVELTLLLFRNANEVGQGRGAELRIDDQHVGRGRDQRHRCQFLQRVVVETLAEQRRGHERPLDREQQGVAVGLGLRDDTGAEVAAGPRSVVDDDRLSERLAERLGDQAGDEVGRAAGWKWHDELDWPRGP